MHEYHFTEKIIKEALETAERSGKSRITKITIALGEFSGIAEESIRLYFESLAEGTLAEGADLVVNAITEKPKSSMSREATRGAYIESVEVE